MEMNHRGALQAQPVRSRQKQLGMDHLPVRSLERHGLGLDQAGAREIAGQCRRHQRMCGACQADTHGMQWGTRIGLQRDDCAAPGYRWRHHDRALGSECRELARLEVDAPQATAVDLILVGSHDDGMGLRLHGDAGDFERARRQVDGRFGMRCQRVHVEPAAAFPSKRQLSRRRPRQRRTVGKWREHAASAFAGRPCAFRLASMRIGDPQRPGYPAWARAPRRRRAFCQPHEGQPFPVG